MKHMLAAASIICRKVSNQSAKRKTGVGWVRKVDVGGRWRWQTVRKVANRGRTWNTTLRKQKHVPTKLLATCYLRPSAISAPLWLDSTSSRLALSMGHSESVTSCSNSTSDSPFSLHSNRPLPVTAIYQPSVDCLTHCCHFLAMPEFSTPRKIYSTKMESNYSFCLCFQEGKAIFGN